MKQKHTLYPGCILFLCRKAFPKRSILNIPEMCHKAKGDSLHSIEFYFLLKGGDVWELSPISLTTLCLPAVICAAQFLIITCFTMPWCTKVL